MVPSTTYKKSPPIGIAVAYARYDVGVYCGRVCRMSALGRRRTPKTGLRALAALALWRERGARRRSVERAHGDGEELGRPANDRGDARSIIRATCAPPQAVRQH